MAIAAPESKSGSEGRSEEMGILTTRYVNEAESDNRGIKMGWYAMRRDGSLLLGPFMNQEDCAAEIAQTEDRSEPRGYNPGVH